MRDKYKAAAAHNFNDQYTKMYDREKRVRYMTFIVTHQCNLRCSYCYEHNKSDARMTLETAKKIVDTLFEADMSNNIYINPEVADCLVLDFIGGEPLLEIELIDATVDYFREQALKFNHRWATQYMVNLSSNGMSYFDERVEKFLAKNEGRVSISITIDGDKETHDSCRLDCNGCGSYDRAIAAFVHAKEMFHQEGTKFTIAPGNVDRTFHACRDMLEKFDLTSFFCNCVYEEGWTDAHASVLYDELKKFADYVIDTGRYKDLYLSIFEEGIGVPYLSTDTDNWCGGTGNMLAADVDGVFYPCLRYAPLSIGNRPPLRIGDLEVGLATAPEDVATIKMLDGITIQSQSTEECLNCPVAKGCGWCSAYNYEYTGDVNKRCTFICCMHKARVLADSYYWNRIYRLVGESERFPVNLPREDALKIITADEYDMLVELAKED